MAQNNFPEPLLELNSFLAERTSHETKLWAMQSLPDDAFTRPLRLPGKYLSPQIKLFFALVAGFALAICSSLVLVGNDAGALGLALVGYLIASILVMFLMRRDYPHPWLGVGNLVTLLRMALAASLLAPLLGITNPLFIVALALCILILDGFDGWLARKSGHVSNFGARLDMEVDSSLAMILAANIWAAGITGPEILILAAPRYIYVMAASLNPWLKLPLPESFVRKLICVVQVSTLIALNIPWFPSLLVLPVVSIVGGALIWSFARDILWLKKARS